jgi:hypothetical protein
MEPNKKKDVALLFLAEISRMKPERLQDVIRSVVGEELASAMFNYARQVIEADANKVVENAASMIILGYLIRAYETGAIPSENTTV